MWCLNSGVLPGLNPKVKQKYMKLHITAFQLKYWQDHKGKTGQKAGSWANNREHTQIEAVTQPKFNLTQGGI